jgi:hypothetical protein
MTGELCRDQAPRSQPLAAVPGDRHLVDEPSDATTDGSANCEIIPDRVTDCRQREQWLQVNESNPELMDLQSCSLLLLSCSAWVKKMFVYGVFCRSTASRFQRRSPIP